MHWEQVREAEAADYDALKTDLGESVKATCHVGCMAPPAAPGSANPVKTLNPSRSKILQHAADHHQAIDVALKTLKEQARHHAIPSKPGFR